MKWPNLGSLTKVIIFVPTKYVTIETMKNGRKSLFGGHSAMLHSLLVPLFSFVFLILYKPFGVATFLQIGSVDYTFNITILFCIVVGVVAIMRLIFWALRGLLGGNYVVYALWCVGEMVVSALFSALYLVLMFDGSKGYFELVGICFGVLCAVAVYPYLLVALGFELGDMARREDAEADPSTLVKFYDEYQKLKFVIASDAILFIRSEENYVQIHYTAEGKCRKFVLRSSMRALEELLSRHGLVRCHRSYFINPLHVKMVHKDSAGVVVAELKVDGFEPIPISRRYQEEIMRLL